MGRRILKEIKTNRVEMAIQVIFWIVIFLLPLSFVDLEQDSNILLRYLIHLGYPIGFFIIFQLNLFNFTPHYLIDKPRDLTNYWKVNGLWVLILGVLTHAWIYYGKIIYNAHVPEEDAILIRAVSIWGKIYFTAKACFYLIFFAGLGSAFALSVNLTHVRKELQEAKLAQKNSELQNLKNQVSPHFLLNTLNNIYALTAINTEKAQEAIMELSRLLKHILYDNQQNFVKAKDDVEFIKNYVGLMKLRTGSNVEITEEYHIDEGDDLLVAPMILICLVENAFKHGISATEKSFIHIDVTAKEDNLQAIITNSYFPKTQDDRSGHGIGLEQVERRLELIYPGKYTWTKGVSEDGKMYNSKINIYDTKLRNH